MADEQTTTNGKENPGFKEMLFRFKKDEFGNKRENVKCEAVPVPTADTVLEILQKEGKELELLLDVMADTVRSTLSDFVSEDQAFDPKKFDYSKVSWKAISEISREDRRSISIPEETWKAFAKDYIEIMPGVTGKTLEMVTTATEVYLKKMTPLKSRKPALEKLKEQLAIYVSNSQNAEQFQEILELLTRRISTYLAADDPALLEANL